MPHADVEIGAIQRIISASIGALTTSLLVTPLDVTKTRLQVQQTSICDGISCEICEEDGVINKNKLTNKNNVKIKLNVNNSTTTIKSSAIQLSKLNNNYYLFSNGLMDHIIPTSRLRIEVYESACKHLPFKNSLDAFIKIARYEGVPHLYTGLGVTLWMAAPATVLYYSTYDLLRNKLLKLANNNNNDTKLITMIPLLSGITGRLFAATVISPLELMRTQMMARTINKNLTIREGLKLNVGDGGFLSLWKGLIPTLWRDVPFSGIYWMSYEWWKDYFIKQKLSKQGKSKRDINNYSNDTIGSDSLFIASFLSGAVSGMIATFFTQPFDVLKTRRQATLLGIATKKEDLQKKRLVSLARSIIKNEGFQGLYVGMPARMTRVPISCAIMVSTYEVGKILLKSNIIKNDD